MSGIPRDTKEKRTIPSKTRPTDTDGNQWIPTDTTHTTHTDKDKGYDYDSDTDSDYDHDSEKEVDCEEEKESENDSVNDVNMQQVDDTFTTTYYVPQYTREFIEDMAREIEEKEGIDYPYVTRLVDKFFEINQANNWLGTDGRPIMDIVRWYKQYLDIEMPNGYQLKDVSICEE